MYYFTHYYLLVVYKVFRSILNSCSRCITGYQASLPVRLRDLFGVVLCFIRIWLKTCMYSSVKFVFKNINNWLNRNFKSDENRRILVFHHGAVFFIHYVLLCFMFLKTYFTCDFNYSKFDFCCAYILLNVYSIHPCCMI